MSDPLTTATVSQNADGTYGYEVMFLPSGAYTAAFTCQSSDDVADTDDDIAFSAPQIFVIADGETRIVDF